MKKNKTQNILTTKNLFNSLKQEVNEECIFFNELVNRNGDKIVRYNETQEGKHYESIFNYNIKNGGSIDSFRYYNDYVVELKGV